MLKKNELEQEPLLYITQPQIQKARVSMQQSFIIKTNKRATVPNKTGNEESLEKKAVEEQKDTGEYGMQGEGKGNTEEIVNEEVEAQLDLETGNTEEIVNEEVEAQLDLETENTEEIVNEEVKTQLDLETENTVRKSFKDLDNKQKIYYLLNRPHYIPDVLCECKTHTGMYIGYLKSFENQIVTLRAYNHLSVIKIPYTDIVSIQMRMV